MEARSGRSGRSNRSPGRNTGSVPSIKLEYSTDNFATATLIVASAANTGKLQLDDPGRDLHDREDPGSRMPRMPRPTTPRTTTFKIRGGITVSARTAGELWTVGQARSITWTTSGTIPNVRLEYSKDNFASLV